jgi:septal ring factor EnvC (AmiA/AmiB activator)
MRLPALAALTALTLLPSASAQVVSPLSTLDKVVEGARAEASAADAQAKRLEQAAAQARTEASRLRAQQLAAAEGIAAAEARISAADGEIKLAAMRQAVLKRQLQQEERPISALLGGLATMARQPPLIALAAADSSEELVQVRVLVDATLPAIRARTQGLRSQLSAGARLQQAAAEARQRLQRSRSELASKRRLFAGLEEKALAAAASTDAKALQAGDVALAASETADLLGTDFRQARSAAAVGSELARQPPPPAGPAASGQTPLTPFPYALPAKARVLVGFGTISSSGVRSRGILLSTGRGATVAAPAGGTVRFAGPYRDFDGVIILDHGAGWMSVIVNVASRLNRGDRVEMGAPIGRALGPIEVELSHRGRRWSPALIAGSSAPLSKSRQDS